MQQLNMWEFLLEFSPDLYLNQVCEALMDTEYWMGILCCIRCEILDAEGLCTARAKPWVPPTQDTEWKNPNDKQILPPLDPVGPPPHHIDYIYMMRSLKDQGGYLQPMHGAIRRPPTLYTLQLLRTWGFHIN